MYRPPLLAVQEIKEDIMKKMTPTLQFEVTDINYDEKEKESKNFKDLRFLINKSKNKENNN